MSEDQHESDEATTDDEGKLQVDIEDAGGKELRDVEEKPPEDEIQEMEEERQRRLDPDNRPDGAEVDNSHRDFDSSTGRFTDSDEYDQGEDTPYSSEADPENVSDSADDSDSGDKESADDSDDAEPAGQAESADDESRDEKSGSQHRA